MSLDRFDRLNWQPVISNSKTAFKRPDGTLYFQPISHKIAFTELISVTCDNRKAKPTWKFAGRCYVGVDTGILIDVPVLLKQTKLIQIPDIAQGSNLTIQLIPANWHELFYYKIERYVGNLKTRLEADIEEIKNIIIKNDNPG